MSIGDAEPVQKGMIVTLTLCIIGLIVIINVRDNHKEAQEACNKHCGVMMGEYDREKGCYCILGKVQHEFPVPPGSQVDCTVRVPE